MKPIARRGLGLLVITACMVVWMLLMGASSRERALLTCSGIEKMEVTVLDSTLRRFVAKEDVRLWIGNEYKPCAGLPLDSVDLYAIEKIVTGHSAVLHSEAWLTDDGTLHISLSQRQPAVRFQHGSNGYYCDGDGFVFPLQSRGSVRVPVVDGEIPLNIPRGFKGEVTDPRQKAWLDRMIGLARIMKKDGWDAVIGQIHVEKDGNLVMYPASGKERFLFGQPVRIEEKFELMRAYYRSVRPAKGEYATVNLHYRGQIVCRQ